MRHRFWHIYNWVWLMAHVQPAMSTTWTPAWLGSWPVIWQT